jgi:hypothetical protein
MSALDLSTLTGIPADSIDITTSVHIKCLILGVDDVYKVAEMEVDLSQPWNPALTLSNKPEKLESSINDMQSNNVTRTGVYGGVQLGYKYGLRVVSKDKNVEIVANGKEGISINNASKKVFGVDENGNIVANDATLNDVNANRGIYKNITTEDMIADEMKTSNTSTYMILHDQYIDFYQDGDLQMTVGFINFFGVPMPCIYSPKGLGVGSGGTLSLEGSSVRANGKEIATQDWVEDYVASHTGGGA